MQSNSQEIFQKLYEPFPPNQINWKPEGRPSNGKSLVVPFLDARTVFKRFSTVFGPTGWSSSYKIVYQSEKEVAVECTITVGDCSHSDVGECTVGGYSPSIPAAIKSAYTDATKRAAVHFGVGSYLYFLPSYRVEVNDRGQPDQRAIEQIILPKWALPYDKQGEKASVKEQPKAAPANGARQENKPVPQKKTYPWGKVLDYIDAESARIAQEYEIGEDQLREGAMEILSGIEEGTPIAQEKIQEVEEYFGQFLDGGRNAE